MRNKKNFKETQIISDQVNVSGQGDESRCGVVVILAPMDTDLKNMIESNKEKWKNKYGFTDPICIPYYPEDTGVVVIFFIDACMIVDLAVKNNDNNWIDDLVKIFNFAINNLPSDDE